MTMWCSTWEGGLRACGLIWYRPRWKHSENNEENNKNFQSFFSCKIWMLWSILIDEVSFLSWEKKSYDTSKKIQTSNWLYLQNPTFLCAASYMMLVCFTDPFSLSLILTPAEPSLFPTTKHIISPATITREKGRRGSRIGAVLVHNGQMS